MQIQVEPNEPGCVTRSGALVAAHSTGQTYSRHFLRDKLHSPAHYQFIIHSQYSVSVRAREDIHP